MAVGGRTYIDARVGTGFAPSKPSNARQRSKPAPVRQSHFYRNERTINSVSSEMIASTPHAANSPMRAA